MQGHYSISVRIGGEAVSTDLSAGVYIAPAIARAPEIEHSSDNVATQGVLETFTIQVFERSRVFYFYSLFSFYFN